MGGCLSTGGIHVKVEYLNTTPLALHLSLEEITSFAEFLELKKYPNGSELFKEGDVGDRWYIVAKGTIDISIHPNEEKKFLCFKKAGDFFGENAILADEPKPRNATALVTEPVVTLELTRKNLEAFLLRNEELKEKLFMIIGRRMENYLGEIPFLKNTPFRERQILGSMLTYVPLKQGEILFREGSIGRELYLVYQGSVEATSEVDGKAIVLNTIGEGQVFGEIGLMIEMPRTATISAKEDCLLLELRREDFENFLQVAPEAGSKFGEDMKQRIAGHFRKYKIPFFAAIPDDRFAYLATLCSIEEIPPGTTIFQEGEVGDTFYIIAHGTVTVVINKEGKSIKMPSMGPGQYFGEIALVKDTPRSSTVKTKTRCVILSITKSNFEKFFEQVPEAVANFKVKLAQYDAELKDFIHHPIGIEYFTKHLEHEISLENLNFWLAVQAYRDLPEEELEQEAIRIVNHFIVPGSETPEEINISGPIKVKLQKRILEDGDIQHDIFDDAQTKVMKMMERDSFKRFKETPLFQEFLTKADEYQVERRVSELPKNQHLTKPKNKSKASPE